jgi:hypothetical protein
LKNVIRNWTGEKGKVAVKMLKRAVKNSILADYVLIDCSDPGS